MFAQELTWPEYRDQVATRLVVLPIGALDGHGPHLPLATDTLLAQHMVMSLAAQINILCLPALPFGRRTEAARGGGSFPGSVNLQPETLVLVVLDILRALYRDGARRVLIIDNHMANLDSLKIAATAHAKDAIDMRIMIASWWDLVAEETRDDIARISDVPRNQDHHAAFVETSLMMHAAPNLVRTEALLDEGPVRAERYFVVPMPREMHTHSGTVFRVVGANAQIGSRVMEEVCRNLIAAVHEEFT
jgi:creatinine amidohydrolase